MITFDDVRKSENTTYFFFSLYRHEALVFGLKSASITDYEIIKVPEALKRLPAGFQVPEVRLFPGAPRAEKQILVLVSNYDPDGLERKLGEIELSEEYQTYLAEHTRKVLKSRRADGHEV